MTTIRILRGSYTSRDGERAERGDVIEVPERVVARLVDASYELVGDDADDAPAPTTSEDIGGLDDDTDNTDHPDVETPEPVSSASDDDADAEDTDTAESEDAELEAAAEAVPDTENDEDKLGTLIPADDYTLLSKMAAAYPSDEVHGSMAGDKIVAFFETAPEETVEKTKTEVEAEIEDG